MNKTNIRKLLGLVLSTLYCISQSAFSQNLHFGHEYVDLGLSSGTLWATCNIGADSPTQIGGFYAWGEIEEKDDYIWDNYKFCNGSQYAMTKYGTNIYTGEYDPKKVLDPEDDVANIKWGNGWRMPTSDELLEIWNECEHYWEVKDGVGGYTFLSQNGNKIFFPACGEKGNGMYGAVNEEGYYWTSSLCIKDYKSAYFFAFWVNGCFSIVGYSGLIELDRYLGHNIRPVISSKDLSSGISSTTKKQCTSSVIYTLNGLRSENRVKGISIIKYSDGTIKKVIKK